MDTTTMTKGYRREKQCSELYEQAGYDTYRPPRTKYDETDIFGLFDILAVRHGYHVRFVQVKSNRASGIEAWKSEASEYADGPRVKVQFAVCVDNEGWRLYDDYGDTLGGWVVDERELDCKMGEGVVEYLRQE